MQYEQDYLLKKIQCLLTNFDGEVKTLRHEKSQYDVALKNAELRYVENFLRQRLAFIWHHFSLFNYLFCSLLDM